MKTQSNKDQTINNKKEIESALTSTSIQFEEVPEDGASPLNQPVIEKDLTSLGNNVESEASQGDGDSTDQPDNDGFDVPEQEISDIPLSESPGEEMEIPLEHAGIAADTFLGMADNLLEVGGGFFIKIRKHEDFYDFDEVVQVIDEQNEKNIKRLKLDEEDKALLRPLLIIIIRKRAKRLTPEQQFAGAVISILIKKVKMAIEMRAENNLLVDRIRNIIKEEVQAKNQSSETSSKAQPPKVEATVEAAVLEVAD